MNTETNTIAIPRKVFREIRWHLKHFNDLDEKTTSMERPRNSANLYKWRRKYGI